MLIHCATNTQNNCGVLHDSLQMRGRERQAKVAGGAASLARINKLHKLLHASERFDVIRV